MTKIYDQFDAATKDVSAYALLQGGACIGRLVFKYPRDGMGRQYAYLQVWGLPMVRGYASGCGYDKHSAAIESAVAALQPDPAYQAPSAHVAALKTALSHCGGFGWDRKLRDAGYQAQGIV